jgi:hypothetical protein
LRQALPPGDGIWVPNRSNRYRHRCDIHVLETEAGEQAECFDRLRPSDLDALLRYSIAGCEGGRAIGADGG